MTAKALPFGVALVLGCSGESFRSSGSSSETMSTVTSAGGSGGRRDNVTHNTAGASTEGSGGTNEGSSSETSGGETSSNTGGSSDPGSAGGAGGDGSTGGTTGGTGGEVSEVSSGGASTTMATVSTMTATTGGSTPDFCSPPTTACCEGNWVQLSCDDDQVCSDCGIDNECLTEVAHEAGSDASYYYKLPLGCDIGTLSVTAPAQTCTRLWVPFPVWHATAKASVIDQSEGCIVAANGTGEYAVEAYVVKDDGLDLSRFNAWIQATTRPAGSTPDAVTCPLRCDEP